MAKKCGTICRRKLRGVPEHDRPAYVAARAENNASYTVGQLAWRTNHQYRAYQDSRKARG